MFVVPKTLASIRTLLCPDWLIDQRVALASISHGSGDSEDGFVFRIAEDGPLTYTNWPRTFGNRRAIERTWRDCGITTCAHSPRPRSLPAGVDIKTAQVRLGPASPQVPRHLRAGNARGRSARRRSSRRGVPAARWTRHRKPRAKRPARTRSVEVPLPGLWWAVVGRIRTSLTCGNAFSRAPPPPLTVSRLTASRNLKCYHFLHQYVLVYMGDLIENDLHAGRGVGRAGSAARRQYFGCCSSRSHRGRTCRPGAS